MKRLLILAALMIAGCDNPSLHFTNPEFRTVSVIELGTLDAVVIYHDDVRHNTCYQKHAMMSCVPDHEDKR